MADKKYYYLGIIVLLILVGSGIVYVTFGNDLKIRIDNDKSTFYVLENGRWVVSGREYNKLMDGSSNMNRRTSEIEVLTNIDEIQNTTTITRRTPYIRGPVVVDTWYFDGKLTDKEQFPTEHIIEVYNGTGYYYKYEVRDLVYDGDTFKLDGKQTEMSFGRNMKVTWWEGYRLGWVYKQGSMYIKSEKLASDYEKFNVRLFDPTSCNSTACSFTWDSLTAEGWYQHNTNLDTGDFSNADFRDSSTNGAVYAFNISSNISSFDRISMVKTNIDAVAGDNGLLGFEMNDVYSFSSAYYGNNLTIRVLADANNKIDYQLGGGAVWLKECPVSGGFNFDAAENLTWYMYISGDKTFSVVNGDGSINCTMTNFTSGGTHSSYYNTSTFIYPALYAKDSSYAYYNDAIIETVTAAADTCTYSSGDWDVDCSDNCAITGAVAGAGNDFTLSGTGTFSTTADIKFDNYKIDGTDSSNRCIVTCSGGCFT